MMNIAGSDQELDEFLRIIKEKPDYVFWFRKCDDGLHWGAIDIYEHFGVHLNIDEKFLRGRELYQKRYSKVKQAVVRYGGTEKLAAATGMSASKLIGWAAGASHYKPDVPLMQRMAKELKLTLDDVAAAFYGPEE